MYCTAFAETSNSFSHSTRVQGAHFERSRELYRRKATSEIEYLKFKAQLDRSNAAVLAAEAALADAELDLDYAYVKSPIDGRAGRNMVDIGNLVGANETTLLTEVVDYSPLFVYFLLTQG